MENGIVEREKNVFQRVIGVLFSPFKTMKSIEEKPDFLVPLLLVLFFTLGFYFISFDGLMEMTKEKNIEIFEKQGIEYTDESLESQMEVSRIILIVSGVVAPIGVGVAYLLMAAVALLALKIILKGEGNFKKYFSVICYAGILMVISLAVKIVIYFVTKDYNLAIYATSLSGVIPFEDKTSMASVMLSSFEIFSIFNYVLLAIGFKFVSKLSWFKVNSFVILMYLFGVGISLTGVLMQNLVK